MGILLSAILFRGVFVLSKLLSVVKKRARVLSDALQDAVVCGVARGATRGARACRTWCNTLVRAA